MRPAQSQTQASSHRLALRERLDQGLTELGGALAELSDSQRAQLIDYIELLTQWNQRFNLTAVRDPLDMVARHLLDSLAGAWAFEQSPVLDLGTGAGLPGIPLAIAHPALHFVLLDSVGKKIRFVRQAAANLGLSNVEVAHTRFESYQPPEKFATITARALASLEQLWFASAQLRRPDAPLIAYKGRCPDDEIARLTAAGARVTATRLEVPFVAAERHLIRIDLSPEHYGQNHRDC